MEQAPAVWVGLAGSYWEVVASNFLAMWAGFREAPLDERGQLVPERQDIARRDWKWPEGLTVRQATFP